MFYIKHNPDRIISIALMASPVVLTVQYFILIIFGLIDTNYQTLIQNGSKVVVAIIYIIAVPIVWRRNKINVLIVYFITLLLYLLHYLFFTENQPYLTELAIPITLMSMLVFLYSQSLYNWRIFEKVMVKSGYIIFAIGMILSIIIFSGLVSIGSYSMSLSYYMLIPSIVFLNRFIDNFSWKYMVVSILSLIIILSLGSRGAIICVLIFIILKFIKYFRNVSITGILYFVSLIGSLILLLLNIGTILQKTENILNSFGVYSRSITLLLNDLSYSSGRDSIYSRSLNILAESPFFGIGLAGDRVVLEGSYVHNIFLEILLNFGVILGILIILVYILSIIKSLLTNSKLQYDLLIMWLSIGLVPLFMSSSYLIDIEFWIFNGLLLNYFISKKSNDYEGENS